MTGVAPLSGEVNGQAAWCGHDVLSLLMNPLIIDHNQSSPSPIATGHFAFQSSDVFSCSHLAVSSIHFSLLSAPGPRAPSISDVNRDSITFIFRASGNMMPRMQTTKSKKMTMGKKSKSNCPSAHQYSQTYGSDGPVMYWMKKLDEYRRTSKFSRLET